MGGIVTPTTEQSKERIIDALLSSLEQVSEARFLANIPELKFFNRDNGKFESGMLSITDDSIRDVSIDTGDGQPRYFKRIHVEVNPVLKNGAIIAGDSIDRIEQKARNHGFRASAWQEVRNGEIVTNAGKADIRFYFPGYTLKEHEARNAVANGHLNPQALAVPAFLKDALKKAYGPDLDKLGKAHVIGYSMGSHSAVLAQRCLIDAGLPYEPAILMEPYGAKLALDEVNRELKSPGSIMQSIIKKHFNGLAEEQRQDKIQSDSSPEAYHSYRAFFKGNDGNIQGASIIGKIPVGTDQRNNDMIGRKFAIFVKKELPYMHAGIRNIDPYHLNGNLANQLLSHIRNASLDSLSNSKEYSISEPSRQAVSTVPADLLNAVLTPNLPQTGNTLGKGKR